MLATLLCKRITAAKSKEVKTGCNLAETFKEGYGSERGGGGCFANEDDAHSNWSLACVTMTGFRD
jgi:hypothetical protein